MTGSEPRTGPGPLSMTGGLSAEQAERFERLAWPHLRMLLRTARFLTRHDHDAEEIVQDAMIKAMRAIDSFQDGTSMQAWLMTILRRTFIDWWRSGRRARGALSLDEASDVAVASETAGAFDDRWEDPAQMLERFEDQAVIDALKALPENIRWTLVLVDVEDMDQAQAATILDIPVGTVKSRAHRGRQMLRDRLYHLARKRGWVPVEQGRAP